MRPRFFLPILALVACHAVADVNFVYPPAFAAVGDFSTNIVMVEGDFKIIEWEDLTNLNNSLVSVTMWQLNGTVFFGDAEYITRMSIVYFISLVYTTEACSIDTDNPFTENSPPDTLSMP